MKASLRVVEGVPCRILVAKSQAPRKALFVYTRFLFSCSCHVTCQRQKLQRSEETLMATSYSPSMKKGSGRSMSMIKKTGNLLALRNIVPPFTRALMCAEPASPHVYLWCSLLLRCVCLSEKLYIFNWLRLLYGGKASSLVHAYGFYLESAGGLHRPRSAISGLPDCDKTNRHESGREHRKGRDECTSARLQMGRRSTARFRSRMSDSSKHKRAICLSEKHRCWWILLSFRKMEILIAFCVSLAGKG